MELYRMWVFIVCGLLSLSISTQAQINTSARMLGMGASGSAGREYVSDGLGNPAAITGNRRAAFLVGHHYMHHQPDISSQVGLVILPLRIAHLGLAATYFGLESAYRQTSFGFTLGRNFGPFVSVAYAMGYHRLHIPGYRDERRAGIDVGVQVVASPVWQIGVSVKNAPLFRRARDHFSLAALDGRFGLQYRFSGNLLILADLSVSKERRRGIHLGLDYALVPDRFHLRIGLSSVHNPVPSAGLGLSWKNFRVDAASSFHQYLGMSPQIDLSYVFGKS